MPPKTKLSEAERKILHDWVVMGAPDPRESVEGPSVKKPVDTVDKSGYWSYQPLAVVAVPENEDDQWSRNSIDRFIHRKQKEQGLTPTSDSKAEELVRRMTFTLIGLPPTAEQLQRFIDQDRLDRTQAIEDLAAELIGSYHFGEKWGRHWFGCGTVCRVERWGEPCFSKMHGDLEIM